jgi:hypothetical protein
MNKIDKDIRVMTVLLSILLGLMVSLVVLLFIALEIPVDRSAPCGSGDVNRDSVLSQADLDLMQDYLLHVKLPSVAQLQDSDINGDGRLNSCDLTLLYLEIESRGTP